MGLYRGSKPDKITVKLLPPGKRVERWTNSNVDWQMLIARTLSMLLVLLVTTAAMVPGDDLVAQLRLDYAAFLRAEDDYRQLRDMGELGGDEATEYASWVAGLQRRVFEDCAAVVRANVAFPDDLPCPVIVPPATQSADTTSQSGQTLDEELAALDARLLEGLGEYDERLRQEQDRVEAATPNTNDSGGGGGGDDGSDGGGGAGGGGENAAGQGGAANQGDQQQAGEPGMAGGQPPTGNPAGGGGGQGSGNPQNGSGQPEDIPDGRDDDIVARQLREAAEKETDPELKKKLWEEYRKYKQGT